jgi:hypothetical protein
LTITDIAVGDGVNTLDPSATGLVNEVYRDTASTPIRSTTYADTLVFELNIPPTTGGFTTREIGAFDSDGDLIAVGTLDEVVKPVDGINLTVRINVKLSSSSDVDVFYDNAGAISHSGLRDRNAVDAHDASAISNSDGGNVQDFIDSYTQKQSWGTVGMDTRTANESSIIIKRPTSSFDNLYVYINHKKNLYQRWEITRGGGTGDGFDNSVTTNANGNMWMINGVASVTLGPTEAVSGSNPDMFRSAGTTISGDDIRIDSTGYAETTVSGTTIFLGYVAKNDAGIANVYIDGVLLKTLDQYNVSSGGTAITVKLVDDLDDTDHVVRIEWTGTKNAASSNTVVRVRAITAVGLPDYQDLTAISEFGAPMNDGSIFYKITQAASELAINTTYAGSTVWSGAYHKYCYPKVTNNQTIYIDGKLIDFTDFVNDEYVLASDFRLTQELILANASNPIAEMFMSHHVTRDGCNVKNNLTWTESVTVNRSYQAMWPSTSNRVMLGGMQEQYQQYKSGDYINVYQPEFNAIAYHTVNDFVSGFVANNEYGMRFENPSYVGMYMWDRTTDFKIYLRKFSGTTTIGDKWNSDVTFFIGHCPNTSELFDFDLAN